MDYWITKNFQVLLLLVVGVYSQDVFNTMPPPVNTNFSCRGRETGFYADVETNCRVYHTCDDHGNKFTYYCPAETAFRQESLVCDHAHLVDCAKGRRDNISKNSDLAHQENSDKRGVSGNGEETSDNRKSSIIDARNSGARSLDVFKSPNSNPAYTRSFRITAEPTNSQFSTPKSFNRKQPTFVLSSSVFLRNRGDFQKTQPILQNNRVALENLKNFENPLDYQIAKSDKAEDSGEFFSRGSMSSTTTFRPFGADFKVNGNSQNSENFRSQSFDDNMNKMGEFSGKFQSASPTTTFKPSRTDFKVKDNFEVSKNARNPSNSQFRYSNTNEGNMNGFSANQFSTVTSTTTFRPFGAGFKVKASTSDVSNIPSKTKFEYEDDGRYDRNTGSGMNSQDEESKPRKIIDERVQFEEDKRRNNERSSAFSDNFGAERFDKNSDKSKTSGNARSSFLFDGNNYPYSETLRSMQSRSESSSQPNSSRSKPLIAATTRAPAVTAGTEFPVHAFTGSLAPLIPNELEDDPYYPKRSTTTEAYYKLSDRDKEGSRPFRFSTRRPWPGSLDFEIPEVLPDLNTLDDLVDRRKLFYIPRVKAT